MKCVHKFTLLAKCPNNHQTDVYEVEVHTDHMIEVEELVRIADQYLGVYAYQETITANILIALNGRSTKVVTTGTHLGGKVTSRVECQ